MTDREAQARSDDLFRQARESHLDEIEKQAKVTKQVVPDGFTSFGAPFEIDDYIIGRTRWMSAFVRLYNENRTEQMDAPRFGLMSLCVSQTAIIPYDCPALNKISTTAFTDGVRVFMHAGFVAKGMKQEKEGKGDFMVPITMHELTHKIRRHAGARHAHWDRALANLAQDYSINSILSLAYPDVKWAPLLTETGVGFKPGEKEKYALLSEEAIYFDLLRTRGKKLKTPPPPPSEGGKGKSQGGGGGGDPTEEPDTMPSPGQNPDQDGDDSLPFGAEGDIHSISLEELTKALEDAGMDESIKRLNLPSSTDKEALDGMKSRAELGMVDAVNRAREQMREMERKGIQYPGSGLVEHAAELYSSMTKPKMTYKLAFRDAFFHNGMRDVFHEDDEPDEIYYVDSVSQMLGNPLYMGIYTQEKPASAVLVVIDASSSVGTESFKEMIAEIYGLKKTSNNFSDSATEVLIVMGAEKLAKGIQILDEDNWEAQVAKGQTLDRTCHGGTNLHVLVNQALELPELDGLQIQSVIMFTDSYDSAPQVSKMKFKGRRPNIVYAVCSSTGMGDVEKFAKEVGNDGRVVRIDDGVQVDLTDSYLDTMDASPTAAAQRRRRTP